MTSPVDTSVKYFHSAMPGAPVLSGTAGSLIAVLDACLVNGFGLKTVDTLVVSGNVATASISTGHSAEKDTVVLIAGATPAELNGEWKVTGTTTTTITFATTGILDQTASGTITLKMAPAGWLKPFSGTNLAAYKSPSPESTGMFLRVDDNAAQVARVVGYETMSDVSTGVGAFPTPVQMSGGGYWHKSLPANTNPVSWTLFSNGKTLYLHIPTATGNGGAYLSYLIGSIRCFGDMVPLRPAGDAFRCVLGYGNSSDASNYPQQGSIDNYTPQIAVARGISSVGSCIVTGARPYMGTASAVSGHDIALGIFPSPVDGKLRLSKRFIPIDETNYTPRLEIPGLYTSPQDRLYPTFSNRTPVEGSGGLQGKQLTAVTVSTSATQTLPDVSNCGAAFIDVTGPWE